VRGYKPPTEVEAGCAELPLPLMQHSYRTWLFGRALAEVDQVQLDPELFYCAALLHDYGLSSPTRGVDFTPRGAERAVMCASIAGLPSGTGDSIADAICVHTTPGLSISRDGELGCYVQWGSMVDVVGLRVWDFTPANINQAVRQYPRLRGFKTDLEARIRAEAEAVPHGRFAFLVRYGFLLWSVRIAPIPEL
jgi:hypothetical protein